MNIPNGHQSVMPYLMLNNAAGFITFMQNVFAATLQHISYRDEALQVVMHGELNCGGSTIMFCDTTEDWKEQTANMFIYVNDADATYQKATGAGAITIMPPEDKDYGRSCGVRDAFGNTWWITSVK